MLLLNALFTRNVGTYLAVSRNFVISMLCQDAFLGSIKNAREILSHMMTRG